MIIWKKNVKYIVFLFRIEHRGLEYKTWFLRQYQRAQGCMVSSRSNSVIDLTLSTAMKFASQMELEILSPATPLQSRAF